MTADRPPPLPAGVRAAAGALLGLPMLALLIVPIYAKDEPTLWGFPFFYWWQFLWVFIAAACTWAAYVVIDRARRDRRDRTDGTDRTDLTNRTDRADLTDDAERGRR
ncbi:MAG: DUF3311 domain-containing protein [Actinomycetota bacterium]